MRQPTNSEQAPLDIIHAALRDAVLAPTDREAINIAGEALRRLRDIARADAASTSNEPERSAR